MDALSTTSSAASSVDGRSSGAGGNANDYLNIGMFAGSSGGSSGGASSDLLNNGFLGNGFGNSDVNSGTSFDLSDFPSLGGGVAAPGAATSGGNGLAAALRQQQMFAQQQQAQQQMLKGGTGGSNLYRLAMTGANGNFNMATEDFPALGTGAAPSAGNGPGTSGLGSSALLSGNAPTRGSNNGGGSGLYAEVENNATSQVEGAAGLLGGSGLGNLGGLRGLQQSSGNVQQHGVGQRPTSSSAAPGGSSAVGAAPGSALSGDYGLLGLLGVIRMTDADRNALALGSDLAMLGLNLGSADQIYSTFNSPWSDSKASKEPHFQLPSCYYMQPPQLKTGHLSKFQLETLFYIFYALSKDVLQAYAAQELYAREWRYHGEHKLWFKLAGPSDGVAANSSGSPQHLFFDINSWERRLFNDNMDQNITSGFLPEEEVRVKFPSS